MDIRSYLTDIITQAVGDQVEAHLEHPANPTFGDYSTNVAMKVAAGQNPRQAAETLVEKIKAVLAAQHDQYVAQVTVAGPGFINFTLSDHFLLEEMNAVITKSTQFAPTVYSGKKIVVEFTDPNPFKQFHAGHLYSNTVGEAICRLFEAAGGQVRRVNYYGDVGMHVAKSIWGMREKLLYELERPVLEGLHNLEEEPLQNRVKFLGEAYAKGATAFEESDQAKVQITTLNKLLYVVTQDLMVEHRGWQPVADYKKFLDNQTKDMYEYAEIRELYTTGKTWSLAYFDSIYHRVGMEFDEFYPESEVAEKGMTLVYEGLKKGVFVESQGAIVFEGEKRGLHTRVFINSSGLPTYETKELGLTPAKYDDEPYDLSLIITGNEINEYFQVLLAAMKELQPELGAKTVHLGHGMVRLPEGKMSSRTGKIITGESLLDEAKDRILAVLKTTKNGLNESEADSIAEKVGQAAIKYTFLKSNVGRDIPFSFEESLSFQGNSGPYLQYTYVRCHAVLNKAKQAGIWDENRSIAEYIDTVINNKGDLGIDMEMEEKDIVRNLYQYSEVIELAAREYAPHHVCSYLFDLAQKFNQFYTKHQIVSTENETVRNFRLALTHVTAEVLARGLSVLNIPLVERM